MPPMKPAGFGAEVLRTRRTLLVNENVEDAARRLAAYSLDRTGRMARSQLVVLMLSGGDVTGMIDLHASFDHACSDSDVRLLETLAASMSVALENARLFEETQRRARESAALAEVGRELWSSLDLERVMDGIARHAKELLHAGESAIFVPQEGGRSFCAIAALGDTAEQIKATVVHAGRGIVGSLLESGKVCKS